MPRRNANLASNVLEFVKRRGCVLTGDVAAALGVSGDAAYHALQSLQVRGEVCVIRGGVFNIWCARDADVDPFVAAVPCLGKVRGVLRQVAESARGRVVSVAPHRIAKALAGECRGPVQPFLLTAAVYSYLEYLLGARIKRRHIMSREVLLDLASKPPAARPPCVSRQRPAASRNGDAASDMVTVTFKLPRGVLAEVDRLAERLGIRRSDLIRRALEEYLICNAARQLTQSAGRGAGNTQDDDEDFPVIKGRL